MESRKGQRCDLYNSREVSRRRSLKKKPPRCSWQPTVPSWEKTFCKVVGSLDWEMILDMKKFVHLYDNVVKWNDSAGEEAFHNAKKRFLAKMRGLPCDDISLPNPDLYIDEVDWNSEVDPELLLDLEREYSIPDASENRETVVIFGDSLYCNEVFLAAGWGVAEEDLKKATNSSTNNLENPWEQTANEHGWGEAVQSTRPLDEGGGTVGDAGWGSGWETSWVPDQYDYHWIEPKDRKGTDNGAVQGTWDVNNEKKEDFGGYNTSRFRGNDHKVNYKWRTRKGRKRETFVYEGSAADKKVPSGCWKPDASENHETVVIFGDSLYCNEVFLAASWGVAEEDLKKATNSSTNNLENPWEQTANEHGWGEAVQSTRPLDEGGGTVGDAGWGAGWETSWVPDQYDYHWIEPKDIKGTDNGAVQGTWDVNNEKKEDFGGYNTSRFHGNDHKVNYKWRNRKGRKRGTFVYEGSAADKKVPAGCRKPLNSCGPLSYHTSGEAGKTWNLEKPIL